jgi:hypothetical protein
MGKPFVWELAEPALTLRILNPIFRVRDCQRAVFYPYHSGEHGHRNPFTRSRLKTLFRTLTHRSGEEANTAKIEKAKSGSRYLVVVGKKSVKTVKLKDPYRKQRGRFG